MTKKSLPRPKISVDRGEGSQIIAACNEFPIFNLTLNRNRPSPSA